MRHALAKRSRLVAVIGSVALLGGGGAALAATDGGHASSTKAHSADASGAPTDPLASLTAGERTALEAVQTAIKADTTSIATPVLDSAVSAGTITSAQEQTLLTLLAKGPVGGGPGGQGGPGGGRGPMGAPPTGSSSSS
jgi:hypothetical protein